MVVERAPYPDVPYPSRRPYVPAEGGRGGHHSSRTGRSVPHAEAGPGHAARGDRRRGAEAAWLIAQHAIGDLDLSRRSLQLLRDCAEEGRVPARHAAYLADRIALHEGRPQRFGAPWVDEPRDGRGRPWTLADPQSVDELRAGVGLPALQPIPAPGPDPPADRQEAIRENARWWRAWLAGKGWPGVEST